MESTKPNSFDVSKLVFPGILLAAVAAVWIFSAGRTTLIMAPCPPACGELTVSMPSGPFWDSPTKGKWAWQPNALVQKSIRGSKQDCTVEVRYQLSPISVEPDAHLTAVANAWRMQELAHGQQQMGDATLTWAALSNSDDEPRTYYGVAPLNSQRMLSVLVSAKPGASLLAAEVFEAVIKSLKYNDSGLAQKGAELVKSIQTDAVSKVVAHLPSAVFSIRNAGGTEVGFLLTRTTVVQPQNEAVIESICYDPNGRNKFSRTRFSTPDIASFSLYSWNAPGNSYPAATIRVEEGVLMAAIRGAGKLEFNLSDATVSGQVVELAGWTLLQSAMPEAVVDMIENEGNVTPIRITPGKAPADPNSKVTSAVFASMVDTSISSEVFFDPNGTIVSRTDRVQTIVSLERTTAEHIKVLFPNLAADIDRFMSGGVGTVTRPREIEYGKPI